MASGKDKRKNYYVSYAIISNIILEDGKTHDHNNLKINGGHENIILEEEELPALGTVNFT